METRKLSFERLKEIELLATYPFAAIPAEVVIIEKALEDLWGHYLLIADALLCSRANVAAFEANISKQEAERKLVETGIEAVKNQANGWRKRYHEAMAKVVEQEPAISNRDKELLFDALLAETQGLIGKEQQYGFIELKPIISERRSTLIRLNKTWFDSDVNRLGEVYDYVPEPGKEEEQPCH